MAISSDTATQPKRELVAIMFSDIAGYTQIMGRDEQQGIAAATRHRELLRSILSKFGGRLLNEAGDGALSAFNSAVDAVNCAAAMQAALKHDRDLSVRIGIHVGDIVFSDSHVFGDGVNVASRIHALAAPGGICISARVYDEIRNQRNLPVIFLGEKTLKNVDRPIGVYAVALPGLVVEGSDPETTKLRRRKTRRTLMMVLIAVAVAVIGFGMFYNEIETLARIYVPRLLPPEVKQKIGFCTTSDGVRIAYGTAGEGPPLVIAVGLLTHLKLGLLSPTYNSAFLRPYVPGHFVVQYDGRGFGMSDRGLKDYSDNARVRDLEAVVNALKLDRFALYGISAGADMAIQYTAQHRQRVTRLVLYGAAVDSNSTVQFTLEQQKTVDAAATLIRNGFGSSAVRELFASFVMPSSSEAERRFYGEVMGESVTPEDFAAFVDSNKHFDVRSFAAQIRVPTLVVQARDDAMNALSDGKKTADAIPGARFVIIDGADHIPTRRDRESERIAEFVLPFLDQDLPNKAAVSQPPR